MIERKISAAAGASVTFEDFRFSPLSGAIDIKGVKVAVPRFATPMLTVDHVAAKVVVARALKQEIVLKSLAIENPTLTIVYRSDGTMNLDETRKARAAAHELKDAGGAWEFECEKILIVGGKLVYTDNRRDRYTLAAEGVSATLAPEGQDLALTVTADSSGRRDKPIEFGPIKLDGKVTGAANFKNLTMAGLDLAGSLDSVAVKIVSTLIANRAFDIDLSGAIGVEKLTAIFPNKRSLPYDLSAGEPLQFATRFTFAGHRTIRVSKLELRAAEVELNRPTG